MANDKVITGSDIPTIIITVGKTDGHEDILDSWENIAIYLELTSKAIKDIKYDNHKNQALNLLQRILIHWIKSSKEPTKVTKLIEAFEFAGFHNCGKNLRKAFKIENSSQERETSKELPISNTVSTRKDSTDGWFSFFQKEKPDIRLLYDVDPSSLVLGKVLRPDVPMCFENDSYKLPINKGCALIINILKFDKNEDRHGAAQDTHNLFYLFVQLGYETYHFSDKEETFTLERFQQIVTNFKKLCCEKGVSSFIVYIGSHGKEGRIELKNGKLINLYNELIYKLNFPPEDEQNTYRHPQGKRWVDIPKLFFVQACRTIETDSVGRVHDNSLVTYACLPGKPANRHTQYGSYFVKWIVNVFNAEAHTTDLQTMLEKVRDGVIVDTENLGGEQQYPDIHRFGEFGTLYFNMSPEMSN